MGSPYNTERMARERFSGLGRTSLLMFGIISVTKALGFVREVLLTRAFGASEETDAFYLVFGVVVIAASLLMSETPRVLVPRILSRMATDKEGDARSLVGGSTVVLCSAATVAGLALYALAEPFVALLAAAALSWKTESSRSANSRWSRTKTTPTPSWRG